MTAKELGDQPAAPLIGTEHSPDSFGRFSEGGVTKRELFAAMAMQGLMVTAALDCSGDFRNIAKSAALAADALLKELAMTETTT